MLASNGPDICRQMQLQQMLQCDPRHLDVCSVSLQCPVQSCGTGVFARQWMFHLQPVAAAADISTQMLPVSHLCPELISNEASSFSTLCQGGILPAEENTSNTPENVILQ